MSQLFNNAINSAKEFIERADEMKEKREIVEAVREYLGEYGISEKDLKEELSYSNSDDLETLKSILFDAVYTTELRKWLLMPLKLLNSDYVRSCYQSQNNNLPMSLNSQQTMLLDVPEGGEQENLYLPALYNIQKLMQDKTNFYVENFRLFNRPDPDFLKFLDQDYFERIAVKTGHYDICNILLSCMGKDKNGTIKRERIVKHQNHLKYCVNNCPMEELEAIADVNPKAVACLILGREELIDELFAFNRSQIEQGLPRIVGNEIIYLLSMLSNKAVSKELFHQYLGYILENDDQKQERLEDATLINKAFSADTTDDNKLEFLSRFEKAPEALRMELKEREKDKSLDNTQQITNFLIEMVMSPEDITMQDVYTNEDYQNDQLTAVLLNADYQEFDLPQQEIIRQSFSEMNEEVRDRIYTTLFVEKEIDVHLLNASDLQKVINYLNVEDEDTYMLRKNSLHAAAVEMTSEPPSKNLSRYLWYLDNDEVRSKEEYFAQSQYFEDRGIDSFFEKLPFCDEDYVGPLTKKEEYFKKILRMVPYNAEKRTEQLEFIRTLYEDGELPTELMDRIVRTFEFSESVEDLREINGYTSNSLLHRLDKNTQNSFLAPHLLEPYETTVSSEDTKVDIDFLIENYTEFVERLTDTEYTHFVGYDKNGEKINVYAKKMERNNK